MSKGECLTLVAALALALPSGARAAAPEDDLKVVRRAVAERPAPQPPQAERAAEEDAPAAQPDDRAESAEEAPAPRRGKEPQWLRVRITDKGPRHGRVSINLPLALVRAIGEDVDLGHDRWRDRRGRRLKLNDVLRLLDSGQSLVEVQDEGATVRVWVE
jgi:hypothetical protein